MRWLALLLLALQDCECAALPRDPRQIIRSRIVHSEQEVENIDREYLSYLQECFVFMTSWLMSHSNGFYSCNVSGRENLQRSGLDSKV